MNVKTFSTGLILWLPSANERFKLSTVYLDESTSPIMLRASFTPLCAFWNVETMSCGWPLWIHYVLLSSNLVPILRYLCPPLTRYWCYLHLQILALGKLILVESLCYESESHIPNMKLWFPSSSLANASLKRQAFLNCCASSKPRPVFETNLSTACLKIRKRQNFLLQRRPRRWTWTNNISNKHGTPPKFPLGRIGSNGCAESGSNLWKNLLRMPFVHAWAWSTFTPH